MITPNPIFLKPLPGSHACAQKLADNTASFHQMTDWTTWIEQAYSSKRLGGLEKQALWMLQCISQRLWERRRVIGNIEEYAQYKATRARAELLSARLCVGSPFKYPYKEKIISDSLHNLFELSYFLPKEHAPECHELMSRPAINKSSQHNSACLRDTLKNIALRQQAITTLQHFR